MDAAARPEACICCPEMPFAATLGQVNDVDDQELLRDYAQNGSEAAFAALVSRHVDFVYSAALRMVMDPHLAEDVTQAVFLAVARAAPKLEHCLVLSAWLHRTTRNQAVMTVRGEVRRRIREREAAIMNQSSSEKEPGWQELAPQLDAALGQLSSMDRDALLLRYFERKTASEIGQRLGVSEDAAQKRVIRALNQLRGAFAGRRVSVTTSALAGALSLEAVQAAPATLVASITANALATVASTSTLGILTLVASTKFKLALATIVTACLTTTVIIQHQTNDRLRAELIARDAQPIPAAPPTERTTASMAQEDELAALRAEHSELLRLRGQVGALRQQERERLALTSGKPPAQGNTPTATMDPDFVPADDWKDIGADTPQHGFQSFLAALKTGDPVRIESAVQWDLKWKEDLTDEDRRLMEKSKQDYLEMLKRAPAKLSAFNLAPIPQNTEDRTRVFFHLLTTEGTDIASSFEMVQLEGQWKPVLSLGWRYPKESSSFFTSPVFGPAIDLGR
jgi:RNA polymerase sigma factor (sigma-70 family)